MASNFIKVLAARMVHWPAYMILAADEETLRNSNPRRYTFGWAGLMILSLFWGIASIGIWSACYWLFSRFSEIPSLLPALAISAFFCMWIYRNGLLAISDILLARRQNAKPVMLTLITVGLIIVLISLRGGDSLQDFYLPASVQWLRPFEKHFRVLLLAPLWGAWAMMIAPKFCKFSPAIEPAMSAFAGGCGPVVSALTMALPLGGSLFYFHFLGWLGIIIPLATVISAIGGTILLCRLGGGVSRGSLVASNVLTQVVFMLAYLAARNAAI